MKRSLLIACMALLLTVAVESFAAQGVYQYCHVSSNTTKTCRSGAGVLVAITINTKGASANTATVYDNTAGSGTVIAVVDTTAAVQTLTYNVAVGTGLTVVTATGTAGDLTLVTD